MLPFQLVAPLSIWHSILHLPPAATAPSAKAPSAKAPSALVLGVRNLTFASHQDRSLSLTLHFSRLRNGFQRQTLPTNQLQNERHPYIFDTFLQPRSPSRCKWHHLAQLALDLALDLALAPRVVPKVDAQFCRGVARHIVRQLLSQAIHFCSTRHCTRPPAADQQVSAPQLRRLLSESMGPRHRSRRRGPSQAMS